MVTSKLLIVGDSFSANTTELSWTKQLDYEITNISAAGSSEYRILKSLQTQNLSNFDKIIIVHTSPNRIYVTFNPLHQHSNTHKNCDLIYQDVKNCANTQPFAKNVAWWFENVFDLNVAMDINQLIIDKIINLTANNKCLHLSFFDIDHPMIYKLHHIWKTHPGDINHLDCKGNDKVAQFVKNNL
jgi:hypothetical protein